MSIILVEKCIWGQNLLFPFCQNTILYWENNHATFGGAIYVSPLSYLVHLHQKKNALFYSLARICLMGLTIFKNSSAKIAGSALYGGAIDNCKLTHGLDSIIATVQVKCLT